ncbi:MAG TPA: hypothetical protein GX526_06610 [Thermoanaerobacterales bacterium]|nr:hypothetical protein [Thermoanaerobacterales bacterium]
MEGLDKIKEKILKDAKHEADEIIKKAELRAQQIAEQAEKTSADKRRALDEQAKKDAQEEKRKTLAMIQLDMRKEQLAVKQKMIDLAFEKTFNRLHNLEGKEYENMILDMMERGVETGTEEIILSANDRKKFKPEFLKTLNDRLSKKGIKSNLRLSDEVRKIRGGFILKRQGVEVNGSIESLIRLEREEIESKVAAILFEE